MNPARVPDIFSAVDPGEDFFRSFLKPWRQENWPATPQIKIDVHEDDQGYTVKAEIPGVRKEDIDVRIEGNQIQIGAEVKQTQESREKARVLRTERYYGYVSRAFSLAHDIDRNAASARYQDGVLELKLPKAAPSATSRKLAVE